MTHEGRMVRGEEKDSRGIKDIETEYYLDNKPQEVKEDKPKEDKKNVKSKSG